MTLSDVLEIILITYNREKFLKRTFEQIFDNEKSPVRNLDVTILDNNSTDGTSDLINEYQEKFSNIKHEKNLRNIGGNANIAKAYTMAKKEVCVGVV
ncbi:MAG: glycosyltransferase [Candidatus Melainabacteria bacterium]|nr:MAG: glycosyltransferase [Candidatus Melainabacteria bacterium]